MPKKKRLKPIPAALREKKRYVYFKLSSKGKLQQKDVFRALWDSMLALFGALGCSHLGFQLIEFDSFSGKGIVRCVRGKEEEVKAGIILVERVGKEKVLPEILRVSGTLKALRGRKSG